MHVFLVALVKEFLVGVPVHLPAFFLKSLPIFPVFAVASTWFLCRPAE